MNITYNEILNEMKNAFYNECGKSVENYSDVDMRFKAVASEIFSVTSFGDYILKQGFPQTAKGKYLDRHAQLRGIKRKKAAFAKGVLTFYLSEKNQQNVVIPKGTICSSKDLPYIQFSTDSEATILKDELEVSVSATALKTGGDYNLEENEITVIVNPPQYVSSVKNKESFNGGFDEESDESFRERILSSYSAISNGINAQSIRETLTSIEDVLDAVAFPAEDGVLNVCLKTQYNTISEDTMMDAISMLGFATSCGVSIDFISAKQKDYNVRVYIKILPGYDENKIKLEVEKRVKRFCNNGKIGETVYASEISSLLYGIEGTQSFEVNLEGAAQGDITCSKTEYPYLSSVGVFI